MANRQRFPRAVQREIARRAVNSIGMPCCEKCGAVGLPLELHHLDMDAMKTAEAKKRKLTAGDGAMWCRDVCHKEETAAQKPVLAKTEAVEAKHWLPRPPSRIPRRGFDPAPERVRTPSAKALPPKQLFEDA